MSRHNTPAQICILCNVDCNTVCCKLVLYVLLLMCSLVLPVCTYACVDSCMMTPVSVFKHACSGVAVQ